MAKAQEEQSTKAPDEKITTDTIILLFVRIGLILFDALKKFFSILDAGITKTDPAENKQILPNKNSNDKLKTMLKKDLVELVIAYEKETGIDHEKVK
ncbi:MAG: hypothetical protein AB8A40_02655 [Prochlorococcus sp.]|jgi:hypothetical protein|nr:hypothetical protein [Prochlorococcaceae cyanobacterium ETNP18_MAG_14]HJO77798.1 hypothetical protein [Prochlorococcaceae cyanobacterium Fu_MAG_134]|tara:strand:+ start:441 stop:731 length:291 start_codon:yes stop_codon:yes gene_type:complete